MVKVDLKEDSGIEKTKEIQEYLDKVGHVLSSESLADYIKRKHIELLVFGQTTISVDFIDD